MLFTATANMESYSSLLLQVSLLYYASDRFDSAGIFSFIQTPFIEPLEANATYVEGEIRYEQPTMFGVLCVKEWNAKTLANENAKMHLQESAKKNRSVASNKS